MMDRIAVLPVVERELRVAARRASTHFIRAGVAAGAALTVALLLGLLRHQAPGQISRTLFCVLGLLGMGFAVLAGPVFTADCLSVERRENTLGLLFLTDLRSLDVVLGKLAATSVNGAFGLLAGLPMLAIPLLMGGVSAGVFWQVVALLVVTMFLSLALGMMVSTVADLPGRAVAGTMGAALLVMAVPVAAAALMEDWTGIRFAHNGLNWLSPPALIAAMLSAAAPQSHFAATVATGLSLGAGLLGLACFRVRRCWRDLPGERRAATQRAIRSCDPGSEHAERSLDPIKWLARQNPLWSPEMRAGFLILLGLWSCFYVKSLSGKHDAAFGVIMFSAYGLHALVKFLVANDASRFLSEHRRSGALELLLTTPLPTDAIVRGMKRALDRRLENLLLCLTGLNCALLVNIAFGPTMGGEERVRWFFILVLGTVLLWVDARALKWTAMAAALTSTAQHRAALAAVARVLVVPWVLSFLWIVLAIAGGTNDHHLMIQSLAWFALSVALDGFVGRRAERQLQRQLRETFAGVCTAKPVTRTDFCQAHR
ncbi:MAG: hypothetical protein NTW03_00485 [Verrucomicrobia bacterium]|nr:hypothetical protein [Verrucomicrobiota bacterium]